jgi:hypothetical protein
MNGRPPFLSVALLSAALLAYEICLMHLFAVIHFHHFAYMVISLALLGYGASGSALALGQGWLCRRHRLFYPLLLALFALTAPLCFWLGQEVPFNGLELFWDWRQGLYLAALFLLFMVPFFCGALAIAIALTVYWQEVGRVYGWDLLGAGAGCLAVLALLWRVAPTSLLTAVAGLGLGATALSAFELGLRQRRLVACSALLAVSLVGVAGTILPLRPSPYKPLQQALQVAGTKVEKELSSPFGVLTVVDSPLVPLRHAPGLSLAARGEPPPQKAVFTNGDGLTAITMAAAGRQQLAYLDQMTSALPYHLRPPGKVLLLGLGGGQDVLQARYHRIPAITAVELNPQMVALLRDDYGAYSGGLLSGDDLSVHIGELRDVLRQRGERFDLIQLALVDSFLPSAAGLYALRENYLYTVEALGDYLHHLNPQGMVAISRWLKNPPRDSLKLTATAIAALRQRGVERPGEHLVLIRGWQTATLVVTREPLGEEARGRLEEFCRQRLFDIVYAPGVEEGWANRYNLLAEPTLADGVRALLESDGGAFIDGYKFAISPASDDRPYFHHFFKWSSLAEILRLRATGGAALMESGYLILVAVFAVALPAALLLIVAPLLLLPREAGGGVAAAGSPLRSSVYFFATGLAFMLIEIATIQKAMPILHHPVYAVSVVIAAFLIFAGIGSTLSAPLAARVRPEVLVRLAVAMIALCGSLVALLGEEAAALLPQLGLAARAGLTVLAIAPLALCMGMPFPLGLSRLPAGASGPWAWGINGCASVLGSMTATLVAIHYGFNVVFVLALLLYVLVAASFPVDGGDGRRQAATLSDRAAGPGPG